MAKLNLKIKYLAILFLGNFTFIYANTDNNELCEGRYAKSAAMVDAAYEKFGTLYSGGLHWHSISNVGATIDLYRLWRELPDLKFRSTAMSYNWDEDKNYSEEDIRSYLWVADTVEKHSDEEISDAAITWDFLTVIGNPIDWWLKNDYFNKDTPRQNLLAKVAKESDFLNWIQYAVTASDTPWSIAWHLKSTQNFGQTYVDLRNRALAKYQQGDGIEWAVMAFQFQDPSFPYYPKDKGVSYYFKAVDSARGEKKTKALHDIFLDWNNKVMSCSATPQEYAAWAMSSANFALWDSHYSGYADDPHTSGTFDKNYYRFLPITIKNKLIQNLAWKYVLYGFNPEGLFWRKGSFDSSYIDKLYEIADTSELKSWINTGRSYGAKSIEELIDIHKGQEISTKSIRILNLLSTEDLLTFWRQVNLADSDNTKNFKNALLKSIFIRNFILGKYEATLSLLPDLKQVSPQYLQEITEIEARAVPAQVKLAMVIMIDPHLSTWIVGDESSDYFDDDLALDVREKKNYGWDDYYRSQALPDELAQGVALQGDFETWLRLPEKWYRFRGMKGYSIKAIARNLQARIYLESAEAFLQQRSTLKMSGQAKIYFDSPYEFPRGIYDLFAWNEVYQFTDPNFSRILRSRVSTIITDWVEQENTSWIKRYFGNHDYMAEYLHQIVQLNNPSYQSKINGKPAGKIAFKLLHKYFKKSEWANKTPYWYF